MTSTLRPAPLAKALELRDRLRAAGVKFVHWKSNDHLAEALAGLTDIDLYVPPSDREAFATAMAGLGAQHIIGQPWSTYPNVEDWLLFDEASGGFLHLHQHFALMTGLKRVKHLAIPWGPMLMENLREDGASGWPIPAAEMEFIILLVRIWAKMPPWRRAFGQRIPGSIRKELDWLRKDSNPETVRALLARLLPGVPPAAVLEVATAENPSKAQIISAARLLNRALINSERLPWGRALGQAAGRNGAMAVRRGLRPLSPRAQVGKTLPVCGVTVAVIGSDGAGKSTVTAALTKWLRFKLDTECLYLGTGDGGSGLFDLTRRAVRGAVRAVKPKTDTSAARPTRREGDKRGNRVVALHHLLLLRQKLARLRLARALAADGRMVILDRFSARPVCRPE
ncbi:MAG: hypothetical protein U1E15_11655 [Hyphomicrobiales bacterium]